VTAAHGAGYEFKYRNGYRPVYNDEEITRKLEEVAREEFGDEAVVHLKPSMGGEDFSAFLQKAPGSFFNIGAGNREKGIVYPHHHPRFDLDEDSFEIAVRMFVKSALKLLDVRVDNRR
jgi:amidohydrolase